MSESLSVTLEDTLVSLDSLEVQSLIQRQSAPRATPMAVFTLYGALIAGTGGLFGSNNLPAVPEWTSYPAVQVQVAGSKEKSVAVASVAESIRTIRDTFALKMSEVAQILGVSRQAAYDWLAGSVPRPEISTRIWELNRAAEQLSAAGIARIEHFVHRPMLQDGKTLFFLLMSGGNISDAIAQIKQAARAEASSRLSASGRHPGTLGRNASANVDWATPILPERQKN